MFVIPWSLWICQYTVAIVGAGWKIQDRIQDGRQKLMHWVVVHVLLYWFDVSYFIKLIIFIFVVYVWTF